MRTTAPSGVSLVGLVSSNWSSPYDTWADRPQGSAGDTWIERAGWVPPQDVRAVRTLLAQARREAKAVRQARRAIVATPGAAPIAGSPAGSGAAVVGGPQPVEVAFSFGIGELLLIGVAGYALWTMVKG